MAFFVQIIQINLVLKNSIQLLESMSLRSNNTNKLSPQEPLFTQTQYLFSSNNTNKLSPQELIGYLIVKLVVQIIQINLVLKNQH